MTLRQLFASALVVVLSIHDGGQAQPLTVQDIAPTVTLDSGTFVGVGDGTVDRFLGIPFAKPPYVLSILYFYLTM